MVQLLARSAVTWSASLATPQKVLRDFSSAQSSMVAERRLGVDTREAQAFRSMEPVASTSKEKHENEVVSKKQDEILLKK